MAGSSLVDGRVTDWLLANDVKCVPYKMDVFISRMHRPSPIARPASVARKLEMQLCTDLASYYGSVVYSTLSHPGSILTDQRW